ncbi:YolD-like protein [Paraliobacillus sp. PM-2]|uniref:YolD-like family protein n=1 Tax=Paraliobacillus sp. PM-2 TaxID=1462524 RepID=UPI00061BC588|nr:YolD-like family protein [Paraliobacillus sp. PM-2]CQR48202.1 YolD-like protein [Paraliobacillus sp. PM-2]
MKPNKLTPGYNIMWESSRMILPEHKAILRKHQKEQKKYERPIFDEQQLAQLSEEVSLAFYKQSEVQIETYHPQQSIYLTGEIKKIDQQQQAIKIVNNEMVDWISFNDVLRITFLT